MKIIARKLDFVENYIAESTLYFVFYNKNEIEDNNLLSSIFFS